MHRLINAPIHFNVLICVLVLGLQAPFNVVDAMTMKQLQSTLDMMRSICAPKFKVSMDLLDGLKGGQFIEDNKELKCYTMCIAQMAGTMNKKGEISITKTLQQLETMLPDEIKEPAKEVVNKCKDVQKSYKEPCDRAYYSAKCAYDTNPAIFFFP